MRVLHGCRHALLVVQLLIDGILCHVCALSNKDIDFVGGGHRLSQSYPDAQADQGGHAAVRDSGGKVDADVKGLGMDEDVFLAHNSQLLQGVRILGVVNVPYQLYILLFLALASLTEYVLDGGLFRHRLASETGDALVINNRIRIVHFRQSRRRLSNSVPPQIRRTMETSFWHNVGSMRDLIGSDWDSQSLLEPAIFSKFSTGIKVAAVIDERHPRSVGRQC